MLSAEQKRLCMTVSEMADELGVSKPTAYNLANRADFPAIRFGKRVIIPRKPFEDWLTGTVANGLAFIEPETNRGRR